MSAEEAMVESRGARLWTTVSGDPSAATVLLCGGGPGCCDYLAPVAALLEGVARVIRWEPSGCGRSDRNPPYSIDACLTDVESIRRHYGVERWLVGGHSWGADMALMYALAHPDKTDAVFCLAGGRFTNDREWHRLYEMGRDSGREGTPLWDYPPNMQVNREGNAAWKRYVQRPELWRDLSRLDLPALFLCGDEDIRPSWPVEQVAHLMPQGEFVRLIGADHYIWTTHDEELGVRLRAFVRRVSGE